MQQVKSYLKKKNISKLIVIKITLILCSTSSIATASSVDKFSEKLFSLATEKSKNFSFRIKANHIKDLLVNKAFMKVETDFYGQVNVKDHVPKLKVIGLGSKHKKLIESVRQSLVQKSNLVTGKGLASWLKSHTFVEKREKYLRYKDESGLLETAEIKVFLQGNRLTIVEKKPTGTLKTTYLYKRYPWSEGKLVLDEVKRETYEGNQSIIVENKIKYMGSENHGWLPGELKSSVVQKVNAGSESVVERRLEESYQFGDYSFK